jgi:hypothetical protein
MLFQVRRKLKFEIEFRCIMCDACPSWPLFTESICQYKQIDHRGQHEILAYKHPSQAQNAERVTRQCSETTINASKAERENGVTGMADSILKPFICVLQRIVSWKSGEIYYSDMGLELGLGVAILEQTGMYDWSSVNSFSPTIHSKFPEGYLA